MLRWQCWQGRGEHQYTSHLNDPEIEEEPRKAAASGLCCTSKLSAQLSGSKSSRTKRTMASSSPPTAVRPAHTQDHVYWKFLRAWYPRPEPWTQAGKSLSTWLAVDTDEPKLEKFWSVRIKEATLEVVL